MAPDETANTPVLTSDFDYHLPPELIAQVPIEPRDSSRLLVVDRTKRLIQHAAFSDLDRFLKRGDLLVLNNSRVLAARLLGRRVPTGGAVEALIVHERAPGQWEALLKPGKRIAPGQVLAFERAGKSVTATVDGWIEDGLCLLQFEADAHPERLGAVPLPPYIHAQLDDPERYQTVYAERPGSAAAPTAGLHFTPELFERLRQAGIESAFLTLHVGPGTFRPVHVEDAREHPMHAEFFSLDDQTAQAINRARAEGRRIIAVGTTSVRVLEQLGADAGDQELRACQGWTRLLILPGYRYRLVESLITNFHLPRSTLLMLVSALMGRELMFEAYEEAIQQRYRFYSFGDAMLIL